MNKEETKAAIAVMQGYVDGKEIQCTDVLGKTGYWSNPVFPQWDFSLYKYRIKPVKEVLRYRVALFSHGGYDCVQTVYENFNKNESPTFVRFLSDWTELTEV